METAGCVTVEEMEKHLKGKTVEQKLESFGNTIYLHYCPKKIGEKQATKRAPSGPEKTKKQQKIETIKKPRRTKSGDCARNQVKQKRRDRNRFVYISNLSTMS